MKVGPIEITLYRTVRVADGQAASNLPPNLGTMRTYNVKDYKDKCPESWEEDGVFVALHETEAMWMGFYSTKPVAMLIGAGGINAINGGKLGTKLETDNYIVVPPQPWLDGWKGEDGTVCQFVSTAYKGGEGLTVGEQLIGAESKTGGIGIAVFESKEPLSAKNKPVETWGSSAYGSTLTMSMSGICASGLHLNSSAQTSMRSMARSFDEMGVGKGGKIKQKIYPDPHGLEVWKDKPVAMSVIYLVNAETAEEITGEKVDKPVISEAYDGKWFGLKDADEPDVPGSSKFVGLKSAFTGDTSNTAAATPGIPDDIEGDY